MESFIAFNDNPSYIKQNNVQIFLKHELFSLIL